MILGDGKLVEDAHARVPAYGRPKWDGLAYIAYASEADMKSLLGQDKYTKRVIADEKTAFRMVTRNVAPRVHHPAEPYAPRPRSAW